LDAERLDWLIENEATVLNHDGKYWVQDYFEVQIGGYAESGRAAIDAAIAALDSEESK